MLIGYARVSTQDQNLDLQIAALQQFGCERQYIEQASGTKTDRLKLQEALDYMREGDTLVVWKLDRLARSTQHLLQISEKLRLEGKHLISVTEQIDTTTPLGKFYFTLTAAIAEMERGIIVERTKAGLVAARARGRMGGRPRVANAIKAHILMLYQEQALSLQEIADETGVSRTTVIRYTESLRPKTTEGGIR